MWLTEQEVADLTRRVKPAAQARVLLKVGIPFRMVDNRPIVLRSDIETAVRPQRPQVKLRLA